MQPPSTFSLSLNQLNSGSKTLQIIQQTARKKWQNLLGWPNLAVQCFRHFLIISEPLNFQSTRLVTLHILSVTVKHQFIHFQAVVITNVSRSSLSWCVPVSARFVYFHVIRFSIYRTIKFFTFSYASHHEVTWENEVQFHTFLTSALHGGKWSALWPSQVHLGKGPSYASNRRLGKPKIWCRHVWEENIFLPLPGIEPWLISHPVHSPVTLLRCTGFWFSHAYIIMVFPSKVRISLQNKNKLLNK